MLAPRLSFVCAILSASAVGLCGVASAATPLDHLRAAPKPRFREGHTLPPLTRWGWMMSYDVRVELAEHWGYALELGEANAGLVKQLEDAKSIPSKLCALTASDPKRYPLFVMAARPCHGKEFIQACPPETWTCDAQGNPAKGQIWSPEAPTSVFQRAGELVAEPLRKILEKAPIAVIINGGEYALSVAGHHAKFWGQDPRIVKAKGEKGWFDYISESRVRQEMPITDAVRKACPNRSLYIWYYVEGCPHRHSGETGWQAWAWDYKAMKPVSDLPSGSIYFNHFNSGWTGKDDMLSQALNSVAQQTAEGQPLSYNWVCGGWTRDKMGEQAFSDVAHYTGFLKCWYTAGMVGAVAGYFAYPKGGFEGDAGPEPPSWLAQMMALGHVHALFSQVEDFLRNGDLLPGPDKHRWSKDLPAYEFPTGDPDARVLARKHRARDEWLLTAWAGGGPDREIAATIPGLGEVRLSARACGTVYRATLKDGRPALAQVDTEDRVQ